MLRRPHDHRSPEFPSAAKPGGSPREVVEAKIEPVNQFAVEMDGFAQAILANKPVRTPGADGLADLRVIAAIAEAAAGGGTVKIAKG